METTAARARRRPASPDHQQRDSPANRVRAKDGCVDGTRGLFVGCYLRMATARPLLWGVLGRLRRPRAPSVAGLQPGR